MFKEFYIFLKQYGVIGLAIAVIIGGKLNSLVSSLVNDLITPLIFLPVLKNISVEDISKLNYQGIFYGRVVAALIDFILVAFLIFLFSKKLMKEVELKK
jgi:large conductance mechanosensitive channel